MEDLSFGVETHPIAIARYNYKPRIGHALSHLEHVITHRSSLQIDGKPLCQFTASIVDECFSVSANGNNKVARANAVVTRWSKERSPNLKRGPALEVLSHFVIHRQFPVFLRDQKAIPLTPIVVNDRQMFDVLTLKMQRKR